MEKLDLTKQLKPPSLPAAKEVAVVDVPGMNVLMSDGRTGPDATQGRHHEIYPGDRRTVKPENLQTVLRHAVTATA